jgi:hypothetical protein
MEDFSNSRKISRRKFFEAAGIFTAAGIMAACPAQGLSTSTPNNSSGVDRLQASFDLSPLNAQTFWIFVNNRDYPLGRRAIASQLNISPNTLKDHITRIIKHVQVAGYPGVSTMNDAVYFAVNYLALNENNSTHG